MWSKLLLPRTRTRSLRTFAVSDFGWAKTTRRNFSGSSERSSILLMALADSPASPTDSGVKSVRSAVSYPSFARNAVIASGEASSATSFGVRSRSVGCGTGGLQNIKSQANSWHLHILFHQPGSNSQRRTEERRTRNWTEIHGGAGNTMNALPPTR
jgi:hypothetical protein